MKFGWFILSDGLLRKITLIIGVAEQIQGGPNTSVIVTNVGTFTTLTWEVCDEPSTTVGSTIGAFWEKIISSYSEWMKLI